MPVTAKLNRIAGRHVVASVSGGKDSAAMSLYLMELGIQHDRVFMDTGWEAPQTYEYLRGPLAAKLGPITEIRGELDFVQLVKKKGLFPSRVMRFCTEELKVKPVQRWLDRQADWYGECISHLPLAAADSCNVARNIGIDKKWTGTYAPATKAQRALVLAERIELHAAANRWSRQHGLEQNLELIG